MKLPDKFDIDWEDSEGNEVSLTVEAIVLDMGSPYGRFDPVSGYGEPPSGPEIDIKKVTMYDVNNKFVPLKLEDMSDVDLDKLYDKVVEAAMDREDAYELDDRLDDIQYGDSDYP